MEKEKNIFVKGRNKILVADIGGGMLALDMNLGSSHVCYQALDQQATFMSQVFPVST